MKRSSNFQNAPEDDISISSDRHKYKKCKCGCDRYVTNAEFDYCPGHAPEVEDEEKHNRKE